MEDSGKIRKEVSEAYADAVTREGPKRPKKGCCEPDWGTQKGVVVKVAGYKKEELGSLPEDAVVNSFGCGNPLAFRNVKEGDVVVDLGAGAGIDILLAAQKVGPEGKAIGIDMTDEMLEKARTNIEKAGLKNAEVRKGIIEEMPVESSTVDWIISNCVINLSPEKSKVFKEIHRILKPGGKVSISDIMVEDLPGWIRDNKALYASCISGAIPEASYLDRMQQAGLANVKVEDRLVYDPSQIRSFIESELPDQIRTEVGDKEEFLTKTAQALEGKIWSAKVYAEKPAK